MGQELSGPILLVIYPTHTPQLNFRTAEAGKYALDYIEKYRYIVSKKNDVLGDDDCAGIFLEVCSDSLVFV